jgi:UDP-N-acetylmuramoyl-tripeptide--D-alanyl-D-alanine ligase
LGPITLIDDTYNANPTSMEAACRLLAEWPPTGRRILVIGDMAELGSESAEWHRIAGRTAGRMQIDRLGAVGQYAADVVRGAIEQGMTLQQVAECEDINSLLSVLDSWSAAGDVVLVKGSRCMQMERVCEWLIRKFETHKETFGPSEQQRACA